MKKILKDPVLFQFYMEREKATWLKLKAFKKKKSLGQFLRDLIDKLK